MDVFLGLRKVFNHLERALKVLAVELIRRVRKLKYKCFVSMVLKHQLSVDGSFVEQLPLELEFCVSSSCCYGGVLSSTPLFY